MFIYVHIITPYLILEQQMITALTFVTKRGVDVKLVLPYIPDKVSAINDIEADIQSTLKECKKIEHTDVKVERKALSTIDFESAEADMGYKNEKIKMKVMVHVLK